jgi:hypothetical protein
MRLRKACWTVVFVALTSTLPAAAQTKPDAAGADKKAEGADAKAADKKAADKKAEEKRAAEKDKKAADAKGAPAGGDAAAPAPASADPTSAGPSAATPTSSTPASGSGSTTTATPAAAGSPPSDGATYAVRLRDLESQINELKEQIRRSHTRLSLLSDTILSGGVGGARAEVRFTNDMSSAFKLTRALFVLDGAVQYNKQDDTGALAEQKQIPIFSGSVPPGDHTLQVLLQLRGHGYGVFSYLRGYRFDVKSSHSFTVSEGKTIDLEAIAWEKGGVTTPLEQRPAVRYVEKIRGGFAEGSTPAKSSSTPSSNKSGASGGFSIGTGGK